MPGKGPKFYSCVLCNKRTKPYERRKISTSECRFLEKKIFVIAKNEDTLCNKCRHKYYKKETGIVQQRTAINTEDRNDSDYCPTPKRPRNGIISSPPSVTLSIPSTSKSHSYCFLCKRPGPKLLVVPSKARFDVFMNHQIIIPAGSRCCPNHLDETEFVTTSFSNLKTTDSTYLNRTTILELLQRLRNVVLHNESSRIDFDISSSLTESDYSNLTGINKDAFNAIYTCINDHIRNTPARSSRTSLGIFMFKLKSGLSNKILSTIFNISRSSLRRAISSVRKALVDYFVPHNLDLSHISRDNVIKNHTRPLAQTLFGSIEQSQVILVLDGTYIYIQKSNNFHFQRRSYSMHKGRPLVKAMVVVTTTGYFLTVVGPDLADSKNNDAAILTHMLKTNVQNIKNWVNEDDIFVVDRGFRDALGLLEELGIKAEIPCFMTKGDKQLSTEDANASRLVTKVRWVVESANARIKSWKYLDHVLPTNQIPYVGDYIRIVCAISNKYLPPLSAARDDDVAVAAKMLHLSTRVNALKDRVERDNLDKRIVIWKAGSSISDFPRLSEEQLRDITCGTYQLKLASSYIQEHLDGNCDIYVHKEDEHLIRVKIQSRHISSKMHLLWIAYDDTEIKGWYCKCKTGARVVVFVRILLL